jgi:tRNA threonylcarbamoyladenosine biosynthesis protein TsaE
VPTFRTASEEETIALGEKLARDLPRRAVVLLIGNLGAGKTTLAKGIVKGLGAAEPEEVSSPTFTLIHEYGAPAKVYHVDLYRLDRAGEAARLGLDELFDRDAVVLIEWGERFPELMPPTRFEIRVQALEENRREITVTSITI